MWYLSDNLHVTISNGCVEIVGRGRFVLTPHQWDILPLNRVVRRLKNRESSYYKLPFSVSVQCLPRVVFIDHEKLVNPDWDERERVYLTPDEWFQLAKVSSEVTDALCKAIN